MLEKLLHAARAHDASVTQEVISLGGIGTVGARLRDAGLQVRALHMRRNALALADVVRLTRWLSATPPTAVIQTWMYHGDLIGGLAARLAGRRAIVWNLRQSGVGAGDISTSTRCVARCCGVVSKRVPMVIVTNSRAAMATHARLGYDLERCVVIPNGFDTSAFDRDDKARAQLRASFGLKDDSVAIGLVARINPQKDHANFVAMAAEVASELPHARFVLVGRGVPDDVGLGQAIEAAGLADRFVRIGERHDVAAVMSSLDIFCLSSRAEGVPNALGEAMACETPSVTTDAGDARSLVGDDELVAPIENPAKLAACVLRVARLSASERRALGQRQRERIKTEFDMAGIWARYRDLYRELERVLQGRRT
jgi:glycosyltransferase involved in cell wall biosynthesis